MAEQHTLTVKVTGDSSQLVAALNKAQAELAQLDRQSNQTSAGFDDIGRAGGLAGGMMASFAGNLASIGFTAAIQGAIQFGTELYNIGRASQVALNTFTQLQGGAEQASASLQMLREATSFTVPDTTLMSISNLYTQMGLATDPTEVARLAEMGATLGQAMGSSAEEAMRTFSFLLSNQSIELLDTFGISSGKVRERIQDLQKANGDLARDQAFVTAVLEEGAVAMERLGVVTEQNVSSVGKLTTRFQNLAAELGKPIASGVEQAATVLDNAISEVGKDLQLREEILGYIRDYNLAVHATEFLPGFTTGDLALFAAQSINRYGGLNQALAELRRQNEEAGVFGDPLSTIDKEIRLLEQVLEIRRQINAENRTRALLTSMEDADIVEAIQITTALDLATQQLEMRQGFFEQLSTNLSTGLLTNTELQQSSRFIEDITARIDELLNQSVPEDNPTVVALQKMRDELSGIADNAIRARNEMSLTTALGLGLPPEQRLTADILTAAGIGGRQAEYLTGQRTQLSEMFESSVLPLLQGIETQFGEDEAARVGDFIAQLMKEGIARGFESNPVQLMEFILGNVDYRYDEGQARSVVVQAGDTLTAIAQREGVSVQFLAEINKLEDPNMILTGSELVVEVGARVTRLLPPLLPTADEIGLDASTLGMIYGGQPMTDENDKPITPLSPIRDDALETLATSQEIVTTLEELDPPELTPARMGLVSGDVADVGSLEVVNMIDAKLKEISGKIYKVNMTVELDARIRTGAGFKIIPITMAEIQSDLRAASNILRTPLGQ